MTEPLPPSGEQHALALVAQTIRTARFNYRNEAALQSGVHSVLQGAGIPSQREVVIGDGCRADILAGRVAVEVKTSGSAESVARQLRRYLATGNIDGVVLVTTRVSHLALGRLDQRVAVVTLAGQSL